jgi:hypothetical protein
MLKLFSCLASLLGLGLLCSFQTEIDPQPAAKCCHPAVWSPPSFGPGCPSGCQANAGACSSTSVPMSLAGLTCVDAETGTCSNDYDGVIVSQVPLYDCSAQMCTPTSCCTGRPAQYHFYVCQWNQNGTGTVVYRGPTCDPASSSPCE